MRITIANIRGWIIGLAVVLLAIVVAFLAIARFKAGRLFSDLPSKLDVKVAQTSDAYTLSQTGKNGKTTFTLHASKAVQFTNRDGATLHDVVISLYGAQGDRNDRISGSEFNYDQKNNVITARGEVQIDLQVATPSNSAGKDATPAGANDQTPAVSAVHVKTSGLSFNQKTQVATTSQYVAFTTPKAAGHATGATYDVQKGLLILDSAVEINSDHDGNPILVHASHVEFLRSSMQAFLLNPVVDSQADRTTADQAIVYFRKDGSAEHIDAQGNIHLKTGDGQEMTARMAKILLDGRGQPHRADVSGGINFASNTDVRQMHGNAVEGTLLFGAGGALSHAQARNAVSLVDQQRGLNDDPQGSATRETRAAQVDIDFVPASGGSDKTRSVANKVLAAGGATAVLHTIHTKGPSQNTTIKSDQLLATLQNGRAITALHGEGHTSVLDVSPTGATNLSSGDTLQVIFSPPGDHPAAPATQKLGAQTSATQKSADPAASLDAAQIQSAVQEGNVVIVQTPAPTTANTGRPVAPTRATAHRADYTAANQLVRLQGSPRINDGTTDLTADFIDFHRDTSIADASGNVKATYQQPTDAAPHGQTNAPSTGGIAPIGIGGQGPTHVVSTNATLDRNRGQAIFRGQARLWQGANSVTAPVIELLRSPETLKAYGEPAASGSVITVIENASGPQRPPEVFRVHSRELLYSDSDRKATFTGAVVAEDARGVVHSDEAEVFLTAAAQPAKTPVGAAPAQNTGQNRIDRVVATGHVVLQQPGRRGTGEKLIYLAQDGKFTLTGTSVTPPHLYDQVHGNVSGDALIFNSQDDSVSVTGGRSKAVTDTRTAK